MATADTGVRASVGFASKTGRRKANEDFAGALSGAELPEPRQEVIAAMADGIGGAKGGRIAAETAVRGFLDGFCDLPETMEVQRAGAKIVSALNGWINTMGRQDPKLAGMGCTLTALVLRGRVAHILHVGDTRAYRLSGDRLTCFTTDHVRQDGAGRSHILTRALGVETEVRLDYATQPVGLHDRFLLCSDGVHGFLTDQSITDILRDRSAPEDTANGLVASALQSGICPSNSWRPASTANFGSALKYASRKRAENCGHGSGWGGALPAAGATLAGRLQAASVMNSVSARPTARSCDPIIDIPLE